MLFIIDDSQCHLSKNMSHFFQYETSIFRCIPQYHTPNSTEICLISSMIQPPYPWMHWKVFKSTNNELSFNVIPGLSVATFHIFPRITFGIIQGGVSAGIYPSQHYDQFKPHSSAVQNWLLVSLLSNSLFGCKILLQCCVCIVPTICRSGITISIEGANGEAIFHFFFTNNLLCKIFCIIMKGWKRRTDSRVKQINE